MGLVKEQESKPKRCKRKGRSSQVRRACSLGEESGCSSKCDGSSLKSSEQRNDMTSITLQRLGCYMENELLSVSILKAMLLLLLLLMDKVGRGTVC